MPNEIRQTLYRNAFDRFKILQQAHDQKGQQIQTESKDEDEDEEHELMDRLCELIPLAFEALLALGTTPMAESEVERQAYELALMQLVDQAVALVASPQAYATMADLVLYNAVKNDSHPKATLRLPILLAIRLIGKLVDRIRRSCEYDLSQAARWIRCVVQLILEHEQTFFGESSADDTCDLNQTNADDKMKLKLKILSPIIDQALQLASDARTWTARQQRLESNRNSNATMGGYHETSTPATSRTKSMSYPPEELEFLATILFNMSVDLYVAGQDDTAKEWAGKAVAVADCLSADNSTAQPSKASQGTLSDIIRQKVVSLGWVL